MTAQEQPYKMTISRMTVDKLGIKLYDRPSAVVAETVANSYDADAEHVTVRIPLGRWLATRSGGEVVDQGLTIAIEDDGHGMTPKEVNDFYLKVGTDRRADTNRGGLSRKKNRHVMGRKGIGKLAPFGICKIIEIRSAGGDVTANGYLTAHLFLNYDDITQETDEPYYPKPGPDNETYSPKSGTKIILRNFLPRRTPNRTTFRRQLARRFGLGLPDFHIRIEDTNEERVQQEAGQEATEDQELGDDFDLGKLDVRIQDLTKIDVDDSIKCEGETLSVKGWVAYAKEPYANEDVAGVRIFARGKIVSTTRDFGMRAGFTGEFTIRSYLVGEIHADWLDQDDGEDLIRSDRQDILWDSEKGKAFQAWGQNLLRDLGKKSFQPMREKAYKVFLSKSRLEEKAKSRYNDPAVVEAAMKVGKTLGQTISGEDLTDQDYLDEVGELVLTIAPSKMLVDTLHDLSEKAPDRPLEIIAKLFSDARVAESAALGQIASERIGSITRLEEIMSAQPAENERLLQELLENAPWLIDPEWTVLQTNERFANLRTGFQRWYQKVRNEEIVTTTVGTAKDRKPDFIMLHLGRGVEIVEIKKTEWALTDKEFDRIVLYFEVINKFLDENPTIRAEFPSVHITLVCDGLNLGGTASIAYQGLTDRRVLERKTWQELLTDTKKVHESFLKAYREMQPVTQPET